MPKSNSDESFWDELSLDSLNSTSSSTVAFEDIFSLLNDEEGLSEDPLSQDEMNYLTGLMRPENTEEQDNEVSEFFQKIKDGKSEEAILFFLHHAEHLKKHFSLVKNSIPMKLWKILLKKRIYPLINVFFDVESYLAQAGPNKREAMKCLFSSKQTKAMAKIPDADVEEYINNAATQGSNKQEAIHDILASFSPPLIQKIVSYLPGYIAVAKKKNVVAWRTALKSILSSRCPEAMAKISAADIKAYINNAAEQGSSKQEVIQNILLSQNSRLIQEIIPFLSAYIKKAKEQNSLAWRAVLKSIFSSRCPKAIAKISDADIKAYINNAAEQGSSKQEVIQNILSSRNSRLIQKIVSLLSVHIKEAKKQNVLAWRAVLKSIFLSRCTEAIAKISAADIKAYINSAEEQGLSKQEVIQDFLQCYKPLLIRKIVSYLPDYIATAKKEGVLVWRAALKLILSSKCTEAEHVILDDVLDYYEQAEDQNAKYIAFVDILKSKNNDMHDKISKYLCDFIKSAEQLGFGWRAAVIEVLKTQRSSIIEKMKHIKIDDIDPQKKSMPILAAFVAEAPSDEEKRSAIRRLFSTGSITNNILNSYPILEFFSDPDGEPKKQLEAIVYILKSRLTNDMKLEHIPSLLKKFGLEERYKKIKPSALPNTHRNIHNKIIEKIERLTKERKRRLDVEKETAEQASKPGNRSSGNLRFFKPAKDMKISQKAEDKSTENAGENKKVQTLGEKRTASTAGLPTIDLPLSKKRKTIANSNQEDGRSELPRNTAEQSFVPVLLR